MKRRKSRKPTEQLLKARAEHDAWLNMMGIKVRDLSPRGKLQPEDRERKTLPPLSNGIGNGFVTSIDDWKWKSRKETAATIKKIEEKKKRIAPAYPKGASQYITPATDLATLSKKV